MLGSHLEVARTLLEAGANPYHRRHDRKNALQIAFQRLNLQLIRLLLE